MAGFTTRDKEPQGLAGPASAAIVAVVTLLGAGAATGQSSASRVVDRTLVCAVAGAGLPDPVRVLTVAATSRQGEWSPQISTLHGGGNEGWSVGARTAGTPQHTTGVAWFDRTRCRASRARIVLSARGLSGGVARIDSRYTCDAPARVLVRIRAVFQRPVRLRPDPVGRRSWIGQGRIAEAHVAVASTRRRPIAFATAVGATGRASLFVDPARCFVQ